MKRRVVSVVIAAILLFSLTPMAVFAGLTEKTIAGTGYIPGGDGVGFGHVGDDSYGIPELKFEGICLRQNEWSRYDISDLADGNYMVEVTVGTTNDGVNVLFELFAAGEGEEDKMLTEAPVKVGASGGYAIAKTSSLGIYNLTGMSTFTFKNTTVYSTMLKQIKFTQIPEFKADSVTSDAGGTALSIPCDADCIIIDFSNNMESVDGASVSVMNTDDNVSVGAVYSLGNTADKLEICLKDSLSFGVNYEIKITGLNDVHGQAYEGVIPFAAADASGSYGSYSRFDDREKHGYDITVYGTILSSKGIGISGREAKLYVKVPDASEFTEAGKTISGKDGSVTFTYSFGEDFTSGKYLFEIGGEYIAETDRAEFNVPFVNDDLEAVILDAFDLKTSSFDIENAFGSYADELDIDIASDKLELEDFSAIYDYFLNADFESVEEVISIYEKALLLEKINQAESSGVISDIFDSLDNCLLLGVSFEKWDILESDYKLAVADKVFADEDYDLITAEEVINLYIDENILSINEVPDAVINNEYIDITTGQVADVHISFEDEADSLKGAIIEITYSEDDAEIFELDEEIEVSTDFENVEIETAREENKIIITIIFDKVQDDVSDLFEVSFSSATVGVQTYKATVSGTAIYNLGEAFKYDLKRAFDNAELEISIREEQKTGKYDGGGGGGSSRPQLPQSYSVSDSILPAPEEVKEAQPKEFTDLASAEWAKESILALAEKGVVSGRSDTEFAPNEAVTRAEFCKMLVLALYIYDEGAVCTFGDTDEAKWHYSYIASAYNAGIVSGYEDGKVKPDAAITREDMAVMVNRILKNAVLSEELEKFADDSDISEYARDAVYLLKENGIMSGVGENEFAPKMTVTRAMAAKVVYTVSNK